MVSGTSPKIRLVRCPKCRQILMELPDVPVYECGGCGTCLQAKIQKENAKSTTSGLPKTYVAEDKLDQVSKGKESSSSSHEAILHPVRECSLAQNSGWDQIESGQCNGDKFIGVNLPDKDENSASDQNGLEDFDSGHLENVKSESTVCDNEQGRGGNLSSEDHSCSNQNEFFAANNEQGRGVNLSNEDCSNCTHQNGYLACNIQQHGISNGDCSSNELAHIENGKLSQFPLSETNSEVEVNDESSVSAMEDAEAEADANNENHSTFRISSQEELVDSKGNTSFAAASRLTRESISSDVFIYSPNELLEQPQESAHLCLDGIRSTDTFEDFVNPSSELSGTLIDLSKSPTTRSSRAYYDDGISSYEEADDQLPDRHKYSSKHAYRLAKYAASDVRPRRERFPVNNNHEMQHYFHNSVSILPEKSHYGVKSSKLDPNELVEPTKLGQSVGNRRRSARYEYLPQHPFHRKESMVGYESGNPSNPNEFSQEKPVYSEQGKMELLRMVYELQDQLKRASLNEGPKGITWKDQHIPMYHNHEILLEENFRNLNHPRYPGRLRGGSNWPQQNLRIPFSGEATSRRQVDHSLCCCSQEWQHPSQLPPSGLRHSKGLCRVHPCVNLYNSYGSCPSSPQRQVDSEFPIYSRVTKSDDQRHRNHAMKRYSREKHHLAKRHLRPVSGGAPFITCSSCLKQLQLPADFLIFKKRCNRLRCGACSEVLKFSLVSRNHLIPTAEAPPREADEYSGGVHRRDFTSRSHVSDCPCPDSVSGSDDCGKSSSRTLYLPIHGNGESIAIRGSLEHSEDRSNLVSNKTLSKGKNPVEIYELAGPSSTSNPKKVSSEIEELPAAAGGRGGSPLHRLMGYSSPSQVIYGYGPYVSRTSSYCLARKRVAIEE